MSRRPPRVLLDATSRQEVPKELSEPERKVWIERIRVRYPQWDAITQEIACCHQLQPSAAEPPGCVLVGQTHAGKSTLLHGYANQFPPVCDSTGTRQPVVLVNIPTTGSISDLATEILDELGDPRADLVDARSYSVGKRRVSNLQRVLGVPFAGAGDREAPHEHDVVADRLLRVHVVGIAGDSGLLIGATGDHRREQ